jgi:hypothetical protein
VHTNAYEKVRKNYKWSTKYIPPNIVRNLDIKKKVIRDLKWARPPSVSKKTLHESQYVNYIENVINNLTLSKSTPISVLK